MDATDGAAPSSEKIVLMVDVRPGMKAPSVTARKPAIRAYSIRSWPTAFLSSSFFMNRDYQGDDCGSIPRRFYWLVLQTGFGTGTVFCWGFPSGGAGYENVLPGREWKTSRMEGTDPAAKEKRNGASSRIAAWN